MLPLDAPILIVGMGGLGCPASLALARAGARRLTVLDADRVDQSNLHRQLWHHPADVGRPKVVSAAAKLRRAFPDLTVEAVEDRLGAHNALALFRRHAVVIDATDGVETKFLLSDAGVLSGTPVIYGGVLRFEGLAMRLRPGGPCLRCLFESPPTDVPTCAQAGVLGSMAGLIGGLQAQLALASGENRSDLELLRVVDGASLTFRAVKVRRRADCAACGSGAKPVLQDPTLDASCPTPASTSPATCAP